MKDRYERGSLSQKETKLCESIPGWKWRTHNKDTFKTKKEVELFIDEWIKSKENIKKFCEKKGYSDACFYYAKKKFNIKFEHPFFNSLETKEDVKLFIEEWNKNQENNFAKFCKSKGITDTTFYKKTKLFKIKYTNNKWTHLTEKECINWFKKTNIKNKSQFVKWCKSNKKPKNIPYHPERKYKNWTWKNVTT